MNFKHDPTKAFTAAVTEFGFFALPDKSATEEIVMQKLIGEEDVNKHPVVTVGKAMGAAMGHVFAVKPEMARMDMTTAFAGVFGVSACHISLADSVDGTSIERGTR